MEYRRHRGGDPHPAQSEHETIVSFNMSQGDVDNFMKQPWW